MASSSSGPEHVQWIFDLYVAPSVMTPIIDFALMRMLSFSKKISDLNDDAVLAISEAGLACIPALLSTSRSLLINSRLPLDVVAGEVHPPRRLALEPLEHVLVEFT